MGEPIDQSVEAILARSLAERAVCLFGRVSSSMSVTELVNVIKDLESIEKVQKEKATS